ncbi:MAG: FadR/GntR family transcriptional regulator [Terriglobales bacterium]
MRLPGDRNLTYGLVESLGRSIVAGKFDAKSFPTEGKLASQQGTSRSVTREAVKMLTAKGLLRARPRQGTRVTSESNWNLLDPDVLRWLLERKFSLPLLKEFTEMRLAVEPAAVALAATRADAATLARIEASLERMKAADRGEGDAVEADIAFHTALLGASGNRFFANLDQLVNTALRISIRFTNSIKGPSASIAQHEEVLNAVRTGDAERAAAAMRLLILDVLELVSAAAPRSGTASPRAHRREA